MLLLPNMLSVQVSESKSPQEPDLTWKLRNAAGTGNTKLFMELLENNPIEASEEAIARKTLHYVVWKGRKELVQVILDRGVEPHCDDWVAATHHCHREVA